jgi:apolipoprotein N-acyltransferase
MTFVPDSVASQPAPRWRIAGGVVSSAVLLGLYARGEFLWPLGFVALVPWLLALNSARTVATALRSGWLMGIAFVAAVFAWFGAAFDAYTGIGTVPAVLALCALAPLLQPQVIAFALVRHLVGKRHGAAVRALAGAAAWVTCEWLWPKLLGDTLGHGLQPSMWLRQTADVGGAAGLTFLLILVNEALAHAIARRRDGVRNWMRPLLLALALPATMALYGVLRLGALQATLAEPAASMRIAMVQANLIDYERLRRERGAYAVVRDVLDAHFALSRAAIEHHGAEALLWSETVYPTTFGHPRSEDGAALDTEIVEFAAAVNVPLVFGTYDLDDAGEYNAAAFLAPGEGVIGTYRKTHPFPFTEHVPAWLDGALLRRALPWVGSWQPGSGARVLPLRTADGRVLDVVPLICLDDVRASLAIDGARLGAQAIVGLSNDSWFSAHPIGARLHLAVASFRSIETRLPQLRVTTNGLSAFVDPTGEVLARTAMGDRAVLAGEVPLRDPPMTLMVRWGDWVGAAGGAFLLLLAIASLLHARRARVAAPSLSTGAATAATTGGPFVADVVLLSPFWRRSAALLRVSAGAGLLWLALRMLLRDGLQVNSLLQIQIFVGATLVPALAAWAIQRVFAARARIEAGLLVLQQRHQRVEIPLDRIASLRAWRVPLPRSGVDLVLASGARYGQGIGIADIQSLMRALIAAGSPARFDGARSETLARYATAREAARWPRLDHPLVKFALFPLLFALPAFRLHQHIAFGGTFGEYYTYGLGAWLGGLLIWWAAWSIGLMLFAAALRLLVEAIVVTALWLRPARADAVRRVLGTMSRVLFFVVMPTWLAVRLLAG